MSAGEPFARVVEDRPDCVDSDAVYIGDELVSRHGCPTIAQRRADKFNAAVSARERAAAERALREAAEAAMDEGCGGTDCNRPGYVHAEWLRSRADAIRDGRAT